MLNRRVVERLNNWLPRSYLSSLFALRRLINVINGSKKFQAIGLAPLSNDLTFFERKPIFMMMLLIWIININNLFLEIKLFGKLNSKGLDDDGIILMVYNGSKWWFGLNSQSLVWAPPATQVSKTLKTFPFLVESVAGHKELICFWCNVNPTGRFDFEFQLWRRTTALYNRLQ